jgi:hypothetical protein
MGASFLGSRDRTRLITMSMYEIYFQRRDARKTFKIRCVKHEQSPIYEAHWFFGVSPSALPSARGTKRRILGLDGPNQALPRLCLECGTRMRAVQSRSTPYGRRIRHFAMPAKPHLGRSGRPMEAPRSRQVRVQQLMRWLMDLFLVFKKRRVGWRRDSAFSRHFSGRGTKWLHFRHIFPFLVGQCGTTGPWYGNVFAGTSIHIFSDAVQASWRWIQTAG